SGELRRNVFLTIKESLHNVVKYAEATQVNISIQAGERLTVIIKDNGKGLAAVSADNGAGGNGLRNMRRRIESVGGHFDIISENGVSVTLQVPI
ncbi:MAG TPA: ATP-binding protein, partial [Chitinophagaceae bacterium]|nr:ATP-binding protein [Chitinophagaceae bacterium]